MKPGNHTVKLAIVGALVALATWTGTTTNARQTDSVARTANFGSIGATRGQTVRLTSLVVGPCNIPVESVFLDAEGNVLGAATDEIMPERYHSFDLDLDALPRFDGRLQLRALVKYSVHAEHIDEEKLIPTLEVFDNKTGKTVFVLDMPEMPECPAL